MQRFHKTWCTRVLAAVLGLSAVGALAQGYPNRPIRIVVPYPAGGATDQMARIIQPALAELLGQPIIIDNRAGAAGAIGTDAVAKAAPDGYTLAFGNAGPNAMGPAIKKTPYDPVKDLAPISFVANVPLFLAVHPSLPVSTTRELLDLLRANPGKYNYGSTGIASASHLIGEYFNFVTGVRMTHVPYKGGAPAMVGFIGGEVQVMFMTGLDGLPHARAGKLKVLAIATEKPTDLAPGVPTVAEAVPGFNGSVWFGLLAPAGTPQDVIARVQDAVARAVVRPNVKKALADLSADAMANSPAEFARIIGAELAQWTRVVRESGARFE
ncbi:MAG: tripartite tricarboxylate transporter substrate binding protein [Burkholderiales bacterium]|nr:tripartite tricarboxylate transporter substrate binding protein [Burkholderiales bacterium]